MEIKFPYQVVEVLNGTLSVVLFWMLVFLTMHMVHAWQVLSTHWGKWRGFWKLWYTNKPEIALFTIVFAFFFRTVILWYLRWARNHDYKSIMAVTDFDGQILIAFTTMMIIGIACWIRVISPFSGGWSLLIWALMLLTSLAFGIGMNVYF